MLKTIRGKMIFIQTLTIFVTLGLLSIVFITYADDYYFARKLDSIKMAFEYLKKTDISQIDQYDNRILSYEEQRIKFVIADENFEKVYVSGKNLPKNLESANKKIKSRIIKQLHQFSEDKLKTRNRPSKLWARGIINQNGHKYYVYIYEMKTGMKIHFSYYKFFFACVLLITAIIGMIISSIISNRISKPIKQIAVNTKNVVKNGYDINIDEQQKFVELSGLASSINVMISQIRSQVDTLEQEIERKTNVENMRRQFVNNVSHEMKTPLAIISTQIEMVQLIDDEEKRREYCGSIMEEIENMSEMINDMLMIYSIQSAEESLSVAESDISDLVRKLCAGYSKLFQGNGIILHEEYDVGAVAQVNENFIKQAISNYITNSIKHSEENGEVTVRVLTKENSVRVEVKNQGAPVDESYGDKIWDMFYSGKDRGMIKGQKGSGLGLYLVKSIAELHNAEYGFRNIEDGVIFYIDIPKVQE